MRSDSEQWLIAKNIDTEAEIADLRAKLDEAEETLRAIRSGEVEALVIEGADGRQIYTLESSATASNRFRGEVLAQVSDVAIAVDNEQRVTFFNTAAERQYGVAATEALGCKLGEVYTCRWLRPDDEAESVAALRSCGEWRGEAIHVTRHGHEIYVESTVTMLRAEGDTPGGQLAVIRDITERKLAEAALRESEERGRLAIDAAQMGTWDRNMLTGESLWSPHHEIIFGYQPGKPHRTYSEFLNSLHPEDVARVEAAEREAIAKRTDYSCEYRVIWPDGSIRWVSAFGRFQYDSEGRPIRLLGMIMDITQRKSAQVALMEASEAKDRFLATLSHELRTPLTPALLIIGAVAIDERLDPGLREELATVRRNLELEARLIDDLLDLNRLACGKISLHLQPADLHRALQDVLSICHKEITEKGLALQLELASPDHFVSGDTGRLQQVIWNLLKNATKFTPKGGSITIRSLNPCEGTVRIEVTDTGLGIDPKHFSRLFVAFEQTNAQITRQFGGLGLGLAICKAIVDLHGGKIWVESKGKGHGATFALELPTTNIRVPARTGAKLARKTTSRRSKSGDRNPRILLVEDNADTLRILTRLLEKVGCRVTAADGVNSALAAAQAARAQSEKFDLVVSDLGLPDGDGRELMRQLRDLDGLAGIAISGYGMEADIEQSRAVGFARHLTKPVQLEELQEAISDLAK